MTDHPLAHLALLTPEGRRMRYHEMLARVELLSGFPNKFIPHEGVRQITEPFGFKGTCRTFYAGENGLKFKSGALSYEGQSGDVLAKEICTRLGVPYPKRHSRTVQLADCCSCLLTYIKGKLVS